MGMMVIQILLILVIVEVANTRAQRLLHVMITMLVQKMSVLMVFALIHTIVHFVVVEYHLCLSLQQTITLVSQHGTSKIVLVINNTKVVAILMVIHCTRLICVSNLMNIPIKSLMHMVMEFAAVMEMEDM